MTRRRGRKRSDDENLTRGTEEKIEMAKFGKAGSGNKRSAYTMSDAEAMAMMDRAHKDDGALNGRVKGTVPVLDVTDDKPQMPRGGKR
jgi:hypothetical protein